MFFYRLLPTVLLRARRGGEAHARLGGGLFDVAVALALALRADAEGCEGCAAWA